MVLIELYSLVCFCRLGFGNSDSNSVLRIVVKHYDVFVKSNLFVSFLSSIQQTNKQTFSFLYLLP